MSEGNKAVFLSYASQDAEAAKKICEALRAAGVEVWFDQSELVGGDAWDQKIRKQIRECALLIPVISQTTQGRREAYFRLEWKLADERTHLMAKGTPFLLPVTIDETSDRGALVPDSFLAVQWTKAPGGELPAAFCARVKVLLGGDAGRGLPTPPHAGETAGPGDPALQPTGRRPRWMRLVWASAVVASAALGMTWALRVNRADREAKKPEASATGEFVSSPARQQIARAKAILAKGSLSRAQLDAANELCESALKLDPTNPVAWATAANIDLLAIHPYGYDRSDERRRRARERAERAINFGPDSFEVRMIYAAVLAHAVGTPALLAESEKMLRDLLASHPSERDVLTALAEVLREQKRFLDAARIFEQAGEFETAGWSYYEAGELRAAQAAVNRSRRAVTAIMLKAILLYNADEDLDAGRAMLGELQPSELLAEMPAALAMRLALLQRAPARMLEIAQGLTQDYLDSQAFRGPLQYFTGVAHELAGRPALAEKEWRAGLAIVEARLASAPDDRSLLIWAAWLHAALHETKEAERLLVRSQAMAGLPGDTMDVENCKVLLRLRRKEALLEGAVRLLPKKLPGWELAHAELRFSPEWDFLRGDPRFEKLLRDYLPPGAKPLGRTPEAAPGAGTLAPVARSGRRSGIETGAHLVHAEGQPSS